MLTTVYVQPPEAVRRGGVLSGPETARLVATCERLRSVLDLDRLDAEWALDANGRLWIVQVRAAGAPAPRSDSRLAVSDGALRGIGAAEGVAVAETCVVDGHNLVEFERGRVLVTGPARPELMPAIVACSAIVSADAGLLCHTAIVARELGKPCVVGLHDALDVVPTGTTVRVDGTAGTVERIIGSQAPPREHTAASADDDLPLVEVFAGLDGLEATSDVELDSGYRVLAIDGDLTAALANDPDLAAGSLERFAGVLVARGTWPPATISAGRMERCAPYGDIWWTGDPPPSPYVITTTQPGDGAPILRTRVDASR